jgi:hypothetical protein
MSTNSFSKTSIRAYPKPGIIFVRLFSFCPNAGFLPVVTEIARLAASFNLLSIIFEEDYIEIIDSESSQSLALSVLPATEPGPAPFLLLPNIP